MVERLDLRTIRRMVHAPRLFLFLDCDGTLAPLAASSEKAVFPQSIREILGKLKCLPNLKVAIISGRPLKELMNFVDVRGLAYAGNHGFQIKDHRSSWVYPPVKRFRNLITKLAFQLRKVVRPVRGASIENKEVTLSVHYRMVKENEVSRLFSRVKKTIEPLLDRKIVRLTRGKKVWEIRPALTWNKGEAVKWLQKKYIKKVKSLPVFIGDDTTDEDAFTVLPRGITIHVGRRTKTRARYSLGSYRDVKLLLETLARERRRLA